LIEPAKKSPVIYSFFVFFGCLALYCINLERPLHHDELYHILAAKGLLANGIPSIAEGVYDRVYYYTVFVSYILSTFDESISMVRLTSVLSMALSVSVLYIWLWNNISHNAALISATLFATSPFAVDIALFVRFYSFQNLCFLIGAILTYEYFIRLKLAQLHILILSLAFFSAAAYLQQTSTIGLLGVCLWCLSILLVRTKKSSIRLFYGLLGFSAIVFLLLLSASYISGLLEKVWEMYRFVPLFNKASANDFWFYLVEYLKNYPSIVPFFSLLFFIAMSRYPRPIIFAFSIFLVSLIVSSFAASKHPRYMFYAQPFFFMIAGTGIALVINPVGRWLRDAKTKLEGALPLNSFYSSICSNTVIGLSVVFVVACNPAFARSMN